ncbi:MAG: DUF4864 domain-containing protein [Pikeienuella sp.]
MFRAFVRAAAFAAALFAAGPAPAQTAAEAAGIERAIRSQIEAMQADDWGRAFAFASPSIQDLFRDPENFSRMVAKGYPMVRSPKSYSAGALTAAPEGYNQVMIFEDQRGRLFIVDYRMVLIDGKWRINGVSIRPAPDESA